MQQVWAGVDIGKAHHHAVVIDSEGRRLLSRRVANDEADLLELIAEVCALAGEVIWAIDVRTGGATLLVTLLFSDGQKVFYLSGHMVNRAADGYRGEGKTDARDAAVIADQARMRRDLRPVLDEDGLITELRMLVAHRQDLVTDRTRAINRLRDQLLNVCPAIERALDLAHKGPLILLTGANTPAAIRGLTPEKLTSWLRENGVRKGAADLADRVIRAAQSQTAVLPGEHMAARLTAELAKHVLRLTEQIEHTDALIEDRFARHELAEVITSMPGIGTLLGAEFLAATGGNMTAFASADHLAGYAGLAPRPHDSGRISGNRHRPRRYNRDLNRVFYTSALISVRYNPESRTYYDRKRAEGKLHTQAVLALARRRVNVLWALIRDRRCYELTPPTTKAA
ncbi:transposase IS116/IS110/IS902 family protein [Actinoallomurus bryophytorum]|uniref:Transposase IS116/IS110/IS902 family protein n=1 Tax=Actinoallomurus bryophytorum TaxID=1490222 RepID=A0A543CKK7_9ACTN|nr:transposase IS116/IS110/IS902 family protein [Actinoallomurus bryophytorum]TQL99174.1 transposase IS116/IS110/IS902 family protein [Actinoallomurus bryophytorum]